MATAETQRRRASSNGSAPRQRPAAWAEGLPSEAAEALLAATPFAAPSAGRLGRAYARVVAELARRPHIVCGQVLQMELDLAQVLLGRTPAAPEKGDGRFDDAAWR